MPLDPLCIRVMQLSAIPGFGLKSFHTLLDRLDDADDLLSLTVEQLASLELSSKLKQTLARAIESEFADADSILERSQRWLDASPRRHLICLQSECYPRKLAEVYQPPALLYCEGDLGLFDQPSVAMVGSRKSSLQALRYAQRFAKQLSDEGFCVVSGLALGVDAASHQGALQGDGKTIAVLGTGLDQIYPKQHEALAQQIIEEGGLLVSEMKLGTAARPSNFPRRNRLVSGLSDGVLVVEAGLQSGSLITARFAAEQGREVFAIPGPIDSPGTKGCHALIKEGAALVDSLEDLLEPLRFPVGRLQRFDGKLATQEATSQAPSASSNPSSQAELALPVLTEQEQQLYEQLSYEALSFDELQSLTQLTPSVMTQTLLSLEIKQCAAMVPGGYQRLK